MRIDLRQLVKLLSEYNPVEAYNMIRHLDKLGIDIDCIREITVSLEGTNDEP
jgi:hypothetical protein